ncbi:MAG TPA: SRPBCC domain-containing protein [Candidatus Coatesbacteria bacterium]|nr:SRPBCC domain-containing protein [Candidatus Coatesbacteria bacterium]
MAEIHLQVQLPRPPADVWKAVFSPAARQVWWAYGVQLHPQSGSHFYEFWRDGEGHNRVSRGRVLGLKKNRLLRLSWQDDDWPTATQVEIKLASRRDSTILNLAHTGFEALGPKLQYNVEEYTAGWEALLEDLRTYLEGPAEGLALPLEMDKES